MGKHLYRSTTNRWISGVCEGIAEYTGVPGTPYPTAVGGAQPCCAPLIAPYRSLLVFCFGILFYIAASFLLLWTRARRTIDDPIIINATFEARE